MKRREFLGVLGSTAVAWPLTAYAQQSPIRPLIGVRFTTQRGQFRSSWSFPKIRLQQDMRRAPQGLAEM
jgi:hypothetical protein